MRAPGQMGGFSQKLGLQDLTFFRASPSHQFPQLDLCHTSSATVSAEAWFGSQTSHPPSCRCWCIFAGFARYFPGLGFSR